MNRMHPLSWTSIAVLLTASTAAAQDFGVNGYTYAVPSYYSALPVLAYDPALAVPAPLVIRPAMAPVPMFYAEPAFLTQTTVPYNPIWNYPPAMIPAPMAVREKVRFNRHGMDYKYQAYVPGVPGAIYSYEVDSERRGVKIRERYR